MILIISFGIHNKVLKMRLSHSLSPTETRPNAPAGAVAMLSQIVLCHPVKPDFNAEEKVGAESV